MDMGFGGDMGMEMGDFDIGGGGFDVYGGGMDMGWGEYELGGGDMDFGGDSFNGGYGDGLDVGWGEYELGGSDLGFGGDSNLGDYGDGLGVGWDVNVLGGDQDFGGDSYYGELGNGIDMGWGDAEFGGSDLGFDGDSFDGNYGDGLDVGLGDYELDGSDLDFGGDSYYGDLGSGIDMGWDDAEIGSTFDAGVNALDLGSESLDLSADTLYPDIGNGFDTFDSNFEMDSGSSSVDNYVFDTELGVDSGLLGSDLEIGEDNFYTGFGNEFESGSADLDLSGDDYYSDLSGDIGWESNALIVGEDTLYADLDSAFDLGENSYGWESSEFDISGDSFLPAFEKDFDLSNSDSDITSVSQDLYSDKDELSIESTDFSDHLQDLELNETLLSSDPTDFSKESLQFSNEIINDNGDFPDTNLENISLGTGDESGLFQNDSTLDAFDDISSDVSVENGAALEASTGIPIEEGNSQDAPEIPLQEDGEQIIFDGEQDQLAEISGDANSEETEFDDYHQEIDSNQPLNEKDGNNQPEVEEENLQLYPSDEVLLEDLKPNAVYEKNGYTYVTDELNRPKSISGYLVDKEGTRTKLQTDIGKLGEEGDEGGHLIATRFNGPSDAFNLVPQDSSLNRGEWKKMENEWADFLKKGNDVEIVITPAYLNSESIRPSSFWVEYAVIDPKGDRQEFTAFFSNQSVEKE